MQTIKTDNSIPHLHKDLWLFSIWILLWTSVSIFQRHIIWLAIPTALGCIYWISRYFLINKQYIFPYGPANAITLLRLCFLITVAVMHALLPSLSLGIILSIICLGDLLDGYIARALNMTSDIGEYMDKETDALFVLFIVLLLYLRGYTDWWILSLGLIRYVYFVIMYFFIKPYVKEHKDPFARVIAVYVFISLLAGFILPRSISFPMIVLAAMLLVYSFSRGVLFEIGFLK